MSMPELVADRHSRAAADVHHALFDDEEASGRGRPGIDVDPEAHQRRGSLGVALASP
ncbi:MAG: hypothetical protein ACYDA5_10915 [Vulcanimicrobiaceae bacterium]